jgi:DNA-directed RNA polymerase specialized sigma24 family protein
MLRRALKPDYADMIIAVHLDGLSLIEYAAMIGDKPNNVSHRLQRAEKKLKEILKKRPF